MFGARGSITGEGPQVDYDFRFTLYSTLCVVSRAPRSAGEVASSARRHAPSKRHTYVFDKASQATSISSGGLWGCRGGNEQIARGWIIASRERLIVLCRVEEQSAPEIRASATPRRGGGTAVPFYEGGSGGQPTDSKAGERRRHVWCARQNRLPLFAVLRLDARAKCARGSSTVGCCVWAFGTVGRTRSSS